MKMKKVVIANDKGGASKSTTSFQILGAYYIYMELNGTVVEFDDENQDSKIFTNSKIKTRQVKVGDSMTAELKNRVLKDFTSRDICVYDIGGNKTTTIFLDTLKATRMFKKVDLWVIPASGGSQDIENMEKMYNKIKALDKNAKILLSLSKVRNTENYKFQYRKLFANETLNQLPHIIIKDSDVIDLSRDMHMSAYEIAIDSATKDEFEKVFEAVIDDEKVDQNKVIELSNMLSVFDQSEEFLENILKPAFDVITKAIEE